MNEMAARAPAAATAPSGPLIELAGITKSFYRGSIEVEALRGVSLTVWPGEFLAITGTSGCGKSTLMNILGCLDRPTAGSYRFAGREVAELDADERAGLRRRAFGFIFQHYNLLATATAEENVEIPAIYAGMSRSQRAKRAQELLTSLGLGDRLDHRPSQLSGGQQQRVSVARALMNGGTVVLADEPTGALDSRSGEDVLRLLESLHRQGHTVLLITHDPHIARRAHRVVEMKDGQIIADSGPTSSGAPLPPAAQALADIGGPTLPDVTEAWKLALRSLRANILRTGLTLLGIIIGVASVVAMLAIGDGAKRDVMQRIQAMGTDLLLVRPGAPNVRMSSGVTATLVPDDARAITELDGVVNAVPEYQSSVTVRGSGVDYQTQATSTSPTFPEARDWPVASGIFFSDADQQSYAPVVVLGQTVARILFPDGSNPVGQYALLNNVPFQVIGVMAPKGATPWGADQDDVVFVPLSTGMLRLHGQRHVRSITVQVEEVAHMDAVQQAVRAALISRHRAEDFQIRNMASILETAMQTQNTLTVLLGSIAAISLLVGGIGVMNIMLVSVTERTREIGIRMATGARKMNILLQFNTEAVIVCAIGGVVGVACGLGAAAVLQRFGWSIAYQVWPVLLAFGCAFATGLVFGYLPARKAANLDPVVALGAE